MVVLVLDQVRAELCAVDEAEQFLESAVDPHLLDHPAMHRLLQFFPFSLVRTAGIAPEASGMILIGISPLDQHLAVPHDKYGESPV